MEDNTQTDQVQAASINRTKAPQKVEVVVAPSLLTEGKVYQKAQQLGMGK